VECGIRLHHLNKAETTTRIAFCVFCECAGVSVCVCGRKTHANFLVHILNNFKLDLGITPIFFYIFFGADDLFEFIKQLEHLADAT